MAWPTAVEHRQRHTGRPTVEPHGPATLSHAGPLGHKRNKGFWPREHCKESRPNSFYGKLSFFCTAPIIIDNLKTVAMISQSPTIIHVISTHTWLSCTRLFWCLKEIHIPIFPQHHKTTYETSLLSLSLSYALYYLLHDIYCFWFYSWVNINLSVCFVRGDEKLILFIEFLK